MRRMPDGESITWNGTVATETRQRRWRGWCTHRSAARDVSSCNANAYTNVQSGALLTAQASCTGTDQKNAEQKDLGSIAPGASAWWGVAVLFDDAGNATGAAASWATFLNGRAADKLHDDLLAEFDTYRTAPPAGLSDPETKVWRQAETTLRMGQIMEPYGDGLHNHGMMLASLPPGAWHTGWVRDGDVRDDRVGAHGSQHGCEGLAQLFLERRCEQVRQLPQ